MEFFKAQISFCHLQPLKYPTYQYNSHLLRLLKLPNVLPSPFLLLEAYF